MRKKRSQQIDLLTDFILHIFMIFLNLSFELCFVLKSICIFVQLSNQIIGKISILHLENDFRDGFRSRPERLQRVRVKLDKTFIFL